MNVVVIGGKRWPRAGRAVSQGRHKVTALGRHGGDASGADVVVVAVPGPAISAPLGQVTSLVGKIVAAMKDGEPVFYDFAVPGEL